MKIENGFLRFPQLLLVAALSLPVPILANELSETDQFIVKFKTATGATSQSRDAVRDIVLRSGVVGQALRRRLDDSEVWKLDRRVQHRFVHALAAVAKAQGLQIEYLEPDGVVQLFLTPNDPLFTSQADLWSAASQINIQTAWNTYSGVGVRVAVIDTGYRAHADLSSNIVGGYDFIANSTRANDGNGRDSSSLDPGDYVSAGECGSGKPAQGSSWHGTHVAGTIAALTNNGSGVSGIAFGARVVPVRVLGKCGGYDSDIADAIIWSAGGAVSGVPNNPHPARVLNLSLGATNPCPQVMQAAVDSARAAGAAVIASAGNSSINVAGAYPANCNGVIAVASVSNTGSRSTFSNYGAGILLSAPGELIYSTFNTGTTTPAGDSIAALSGTSMAAPHVAGVTALMLQANATLKTDDITWKLAQSARSFPVSCSGCGAGLLDAGAAIAAGTGYTAPVVPQFSVQFVSDDTFVASWRVTNSRTAPVVLTGLSILNSAGASIQSTTCVVGSLVAAGASCTVVTLNGEQCGGESYYALGAKNSAGVAYGPSSARTSNASCGGS